MLRPFQGFTLLSLGIAGACATIPIEGDPAVSVTAKAETVPVGTSREDAADDPAIWRNANDPEKSLIVGTDKKAGLHVYDLSGRELSFLDQPSLNNVDLVELADGRVLVAASDRSDLATAYIALSFLDTASGVLTPLAQVRVGPGEGYGICMGSPDANGSVAIYSAPKNGVIYRTVLEFSQDGRFDDTTTEIARVASQPEGCALDGRTDTLYIGEEATGIWALDLSSDDIDGTKRLVARVDNRMLVADVEGLAIYPEGENGGMLVASSQGDNAYAVYALPDMTPVGRFRIAAGTFGSAEETDGIEIAKGSFGPDYPDGLFIAQDGMNEPDAQNFKLVSWADIMDALNP